MNIHLLLLLTLHSTATASPLLPIDSTSLPDLTDLQLDSVSDDETVLSSNNYYTALVGQTPQPLISGSISTTSQDTGPLPGIRDSWLDTVQQVEPSYPFSSSDIMPSGGSPFELTQNSPTAAEKKVAPGGQRTTDAIYLCCEAKGDNKFVCDYREQNPKLVAYYCTHTVYYCPEGRLSTTSPAMECQDQTVERAVKQTGITALVGGAAAIISCLINIAGHHGVLACFGLPSIPDP